MNARDWERLRKNQNTLEREICVKELVPHLIQFGVLPLGCQKQYSETNEEAFKKLLKVLKGTPSKKKPFESFIKALRACSFDYYNDLAHTIEETQIQADSAIFAKEDPSHYENKVRVALNENFTEKQNSYTTLKEIRSCLEDRNAFGQTPWDNKNLQDFICQHFSRIEIKSKEDVTSKKKKILFRNLAKINSNEQVNSLQSSPSREKSSGWNKELKDFSPHQLKAFLEQKFLEANLPISCLEKIKTEDISGAVLLDMSDNDIKEMMPSITYGQKFKMRKIIQEYTTKVEPDRKYQRLCSFNREIDPLECYGLRDWVDTSVSTIRSKLVPIRNFHTLDTQVEEKRQNHILAESAMFVTACINSRQNGTVYFGISPELEKPVKGQIEGLNFSFDEFDDVFLNLFFPFQQASVRNAIRKLRRVPVQSSSFSENEKRFVLELDVLPASSLEGNDKIKLNAERMPCLRKKFKTSDPCFEFSNTGKPEFVQPKLMIGNTKIHEEVLKERAREERDTSAPKHNAVNKLRNHLTGGCPTIDDDIYIFLLLSPLGHWPMDYKSIQFVQKLKPEVVFDFEHKNCTGGIFNTLDQEGEEELKVATLNDFDERQKTKQEIMNLKAELVESNTLNWIFCNGSKNNEEINPTDWNVERRQAFKKALQHYVETCCMERVLVVICLFSPNKILVEACEETLTDFPQQWILLSDSKSSGIEWQQTFKVRNKVRSEDLVDRCIMGLPWDQVNNNIMSWCGQDDIDQWQIPCSNDGMVLVEKKKINEWKDLEVVSALDPCLPNEDSKAFEEREKNAEEAFYCGKEVQWLNFYSDHVCPRTIQNDLNQIVCDALNKCGPEEEEKIVTIYLFHEPGAGGSTSARQVLWNLRKKFRCCVVRKITDQTADHLMELFLFKDEKFSKPVLILLDHIEEEKLFDIRLSLEKKVRGNIIRNHAFFVILVCYRIVFVPLDKRKLTMVTLKQFLNKDELAWFERRYADLKSRYDDPTSLISFNILKTNFNKQYIQNTVKKFVEHIHDKREEIILKMVSLINAFDIDFNCIHVSCLDTVLELGFHSEPVFQTSCSQVRKTKWECHVSQSFRVLLNLSSRQDKRKTIRVFNKLIAEHILNFIIAKTGESIGNIFLSLLSVNVFGEKSVEMTKFQSIISNVVKKRGLKEKSVKKKKFSPLILSVAKKEGTEKAVEIMEKLYELNEDPYTAQQVSRFHIEQNNYEKAEKFSKEAVVLAPDKSYLWDTYAQVFKAQLLNKLQQPDELTKTDLKELILVCDRCVSLFEREQVESEREATSIDGEVNLAGYFGELESVELLINALHGCKWLGSKKSIKKFLVEKNFKLGKLDFLSQEENDFLKTLHAKCNETLRKLDDNDLQVKVEIDSNPLSSFDDERRKKLLSLKVFICERFGESTDIVPHDLSEEQKCLYRSRMVLFKRAGSLSDALRCKKDGKIDIVKKCYALLLHNVQSRYVSMDDLRLMTNVVTVLLIDGPPPSELTFQLVGEWSRSFYQLSQRQNAYLYLEAFMFYAMYHFPLEERLQCSSLGPIQDLILVLDHWKQSISERRKYPRITHRETTLFFLGIGPPMQDIVYQKSLHKIVTDGTGGSEFSWESPKLCNILRPLQGELLPDGEYIVYTYVKDGIGYNIKIKTSQKITKKVWWRKKNYFYLGFSFSGLKAYGIQNTKPSQV